MIVLGTLIGEPREIICDISDCLFQPDHKLGEKLGLLAALAIVNGRLSKIPVHILNVAGTVKLHVRARQWLLASRIRRRVSV